MKKLDDKIIGNDEELKEYKETEIGCDCCSPSFPSISTNKELTNDEEEKERHHQLHKSYKDFLNEKLLIVIGISLTIPIVLLQIMISDFYCS